MCAAVRNDGIMAYYIMCRVPRERVDRSKVMFRRVSWPVIHTILQWRECAAKGRHHKIVFNVLFTMEVFKREACIAVQ